MRTQIANGELAVGQQLPSIEQLGEEYGVALVTIRRAIGILVKDGLLSSSRGRGGGTFVTNRPELPTTSFPITSRIPELKVTLIERASNRQIPPDMAGAHKHLSSYDWLRKVHHNSENKYFLMDTYMSAELSPFIRETTDHGPMIIESLAKEFQRRRVRVVTTVNVSAADQETADHLNCNLSFPVALIRRLYISRAGIILVATRATYRADVFEMTLKQTAAEFLATRTETSVHPSKNNIPDTCA